MLFSGIRLVEDRFVVVTVVQSTIVSLTLLRVSIIQERLYTITLRLFVLWYLEFVTGRLKVTRWSLQNLDLIKIT